MLMATLDFGIGPAYEVVVVGDPDAQDTLEMLKALRSRFMPNKVVILVDSGEETPAIIRLAGFTKNLSTTKGAATAYVLREPCLRPSHHRCCQDAGSSWPLIVLSRSLSPSLSPEISE